MFPDPAAFAQIPVYDLLQAASRGHAALDMRFIEAIVSRGADAVPDLLRFGLDDHENDRVDLEEDLIAIFRHLHTPEAVRYFIACIRRMPEDVPDDIVEGILPFAEEALDPLLALYEELDEGQSSDVAFLLASLGIRDDRILRVLVDRLQFDAADGAFCLGLYGDPGAIPALRAMRAEVEKDAELQREIDHAISIIESAETETDSETTFAPIDLSAIYPATATVPYEVLSVAELLDMLESSSPDLRATAAEALRNRELDRKVREALLRHAKSDSDPKVRGRSWEALADAEDKDIRAAMKEVVADESRSFAERGGALVGLYNETEDPRVAARMREFYEIPELRAKALEAMWRSLDRQFAGYFPKHLDDSDPEIKRQAIWGTGYMGIGSEAGRIKAMFQDDEFRHDALFAYALCVPAEISRGRVRGIFRKIEDLADGLSAAEAELVETGLDHRLAMHGFEPVFAAEQEGDDAEEWDEREPEGPFLVKPSPSKVGRNDPCPCGSGKKFKKCHGA
jgi:hypothetical protein